MEPCLIFTVFGVFAVVALIAGQAQTGGHRAELRAFAARLEDGRAVCPEGWFTGLADMSVTGRRLGRRLRLWFETRGSGKNTYTVVHYEVQVPEAAGDFDIREAGLLDRFSRWIGLSDAGGIHPHLDQDHVLRAGAPGQVQRLFQQEALRRALQRLLALPGVDAVTLRGGRLHVEHRRSQGRMEADAFLEVFERLDGVARLCERRAVEVQLRGELKVRRRFAWTGGEAGARCPFCRDAVTPEADDAAACPACDTLHHAACLDEAGGCTVFGCAGGGRERGRRARA